MKKRLFAALTALALSVAMLAGCSGGQSSSAAPAASEAPASTAASSEATSGGGSGAKIENPKVALLLNGPVNDAGWAASAYAGLQLIEKDYGAEISFTESVKQSDFEEVFRNYATQGYNVIIGHGFEFGDAAMKVAPDFPDVTFLVTSTDISQAPNLGSINTLPSQMGYLQGVAAAYATKSNVVGAIGGVSIPPIVNALNGFAAGVKAVNPDIEVILNMTGSFEDGAKAKEAAFAMIDKGADVVMYDADQAGLGVLEAVKEKNILGISSIADQNSLAPDNILLSGICDVPKALDVVVGKVINGEFEPKFYPLGVADDCVYTINNDKLMDRLGEDGNKAMEEAIAGLADGSIDVDALMAQLENPVK